MAYKIVWTKRAFLRLNDLIEHLEREWGKDVTGRFVSHVFRTIDLISEFPQIGSVEIAEENIRGFLISEQTKLFYRIKGRRIILLTLFDTRQNPSKKFQ